MLERLHTDHGALPASYVLFADSPTIAYERLSPSFLPKGQLVPHPLLDHALRLLLYGDLVLGRASGAPRDPGWVAAEPRWVDVALELVALLHAPLDRSWSTTPFQAMRVLALAGTPEADHALIDLVGVVVVSDAWEAWSAVTHHRASLAKALRAERARLLAARRRPFPEGPDTDPIEVIDGLLEGLS